MVLHRRDRTSTHLLARSGGSRSGRVDEGADRIEQFLAVMIEEQFLASQALACHRPPRVCLSVLRPVIIHPGVGGVVAWLHTPHMLAARVGSRCTRPLPWSDESIRATSRNPGFGAPGAFGVAGQEACQVRVRHADLTPYTFAAGSEAVVRHEDVGTGKQPEIDLSGFVT